MRISSIQLFWMLASMQVGMSLLLTLRPALLAAKQDAWISMLIASAAGIMMTYLFIKLSLHHKDQTFIEYCQTILGKAFGKLIIIPYFVMWYTALPIILRQSSDVIQIILFQDTPLFVICLSMLLLVIYATYSKGIVTAARCSQLFGPIIFTVLAAVIVLELMGADFNGILPVYADTGWRRILAGASGPASFEGESILVVMLICMVTDKKHVLRRGILAVVAAGVVLSACAVMVVTTFTPELASTMWYPFFEAVRFISLINFIQNLDVFIVIVWTLSVFIKLSMYFFVTCYATSQWLGIKNWRRLTWFVAPVTLVLAVIPKTFTLVAVDYPQIVWRQYIVPIDMIVIPILLYVVSYVRRRRRRA